MINFSLFFNFICLFIFIYIICFDKTKNIFSGVKITSYFCLIYIVADIFISFEYEKISLYCTPSKISHCTLENMFFSTFFSNVGYLLLILAVIYSENLVKITNYNFSNFLQRKLFPTNFLTKHFCFFGYFLVFLSFFFFYLIVEDIAGLLSFWLSMESRSINLQGKGYYLLLQKYTGIFGITLLYIYYFRLKKYLCVFTVLCLGAFLFLGLSSRGSFAFLIFVLIFCHHFLIKCFNFRDFFNLKMLLIYFLLFVTMIGGYVLRTSSFTQSDNIYEATFENINTIISQQIIGRFWRNERAMISLQYFHEEEYFYGATYIGVFTSVIPRSFWNEKPPLDAGKYTLAITAGQKVYPPMDSNKLPNEALPPGQWEAFWNFGFLGFLVSIILSGFIFGRMYRTLLSYKSPLSVITLANIAYFGPVNISSNGLMEFIFLSVFLWLFYFLHLISKFFIPSMR